MHRGIDREHEIRLKAERSRNTWHDFTFMAEHRDSSNNDDPRNLIRVRRCTKGFQRVNEWFTRNRGFSIFCSRLFFFFFSPPFTFTIILRRTFEHFCERFASIQSGENEIEQGSTSVTKKVEILSGYTFDRCSLIAILCRNFIAPTIYVK